MKNISTFATGIVVGVVATICLQKGSTLHADEFKITQSENLPNSRGLVDNSIHVQPNVQSIVGAYDALLLESPDTVNLLDLHSALNNFPDRVWGSVPSDEPELDKNVRSENWEYLDGIEKSLSDLHLNAAIVQKDMKTLVLATGKQSSPFNHFEKGYNQVYAKDVYTRVSDLKRYDDCDWNYVMAYMTMSSYGVHGAPFRAMDYAIDSYFSDDCDENTRRLANNLLENALNNVDQAKSLNLWEMYTSSYPDGFFKKKGYSHSWTPKENLQNESGELNELKTQKCIEDKFSKLSEQSQKSQSTYWKKVVSGQIDPIYLCSDFITRSTVYF